MRIIAKRTLRLVWEDHPQAAAPLQLWFGRVSRAWWKTPADVKGDFGSVDFIADNRLIFNKGGNKFRLVVHVSYEFSTILIKFIGTHEDYDKINPETV